jgi:hypothetical protein
VKPSLRALGRGLSRLGWWFLAGLQALGRHTLAPDWMGTAEPDPGHQPVTPDHPDASSGDLSRAERRAWQQLQQRIR